MNIKPTLIAITIGGILSPAYANVDDSKTEPVEVITVQGSFNQQSILKTPSSIAVVDEQVMVGRNAEHLEDVLNTTPNVHFSSGASRARFFQVRGIGERSEFVDALNPSVGMMIDGIDYSGIGTIAGLFDIEQVEVFRGPQGTRFGANAMAGMINLYGVPATAEQSSKIRMSVANYDSQALGIAHGNSLSDNSGYRLSVQKSSSDGFINNTHLNRNDTNNTDELAARLKLHWDASETLSLDLTGHYFDLENGYDAFSLDNNRETRSDQPGFDQQQTKSLGLSANYSGLTDMNIGIHTNISQSDLAYGYDEDWTYEGFHDWGYSSFDHYFRDHNNKTLDLRASAKAGVDSNWVVGLYRQDKSVSLNRLSVYGFTPLFDSQLDTENTALYAQRDWLVDSDVIITSGLRVEQHQGDYHDSVNTITSIKDTLWGGNISAQLQVTDRSMLYTTLSRGYKAGGVNGEAIGKAKVDGQDVTAEFLSKRTTFEPEVLHSIEFGVKGSNLDGDLYIGMSIFYARRDDVQLKGYATEQSDNNDATIFVGYIENGARGSNYGIEADVEFALTDKLQLFTNWGWLQTEVKDFIAQDGTNMQGRDQAHAPSYQYNLGAIYQFTPEWYLRANVEGKDEFYYSMSHNAKSKDIHLMNLSIGYQSEHWDLTVWGRNILDEDYAVRGFSFGNDPRNGYTTQTYQQLGEPARVGATVNYSF